MCFFVHTFGNKRPPALLCEEDQRRPPGRLSVHYLLERYHVGMSIGLGFRAPDDSCRCKWGGVVAEKVVLENMVVLRRCGICVRL